jgi:Tol biopolymer transport system component
MLGPSNTTTIGNTPVIEANATFIAVAGDFTKVASATSVAFAVNPILVASTTFTPMPVATSNVITATSLAKFPNADKRLLAFTQAVEGNNLDIYAMHPDGSGLTNLTNDPERDCNPFWSPDGKRIAFESYRADGMFSQIYVMDADGSNVVQLTNGDTFHQFQYLNPWSPDGKKLLFKESNPQDGSLALYTVNIDGRNKTFIAKIPDLGSGPSWSPDGKHVAFITTSVQPEPADRTVFRIYVVNAKGGKPTNATKLLPLDEDLLSYEYTWSPDGQSIIFIASRIPGEDSESKYSTYVAGLDGKALKEKATSSTLMHSWWNGTAFITGPDGSTLMWLHSDGTSNTFHPFLICQIPVNSNTSLIAKRSASGNLIISVDCPNNDLWFYWANSNGETIKQLFKSPISGRNGGINHILWSPDDKYVAVTIFSSGTTYLYVINIDESLSDPSMQPFQMAIYGNDISWQPIH